MPKHWFVVTWKGKQVLLRKILSKGSAFAYAKRQRKKYGKQVTVRVLTWYTDYQEHKKLRTYTPNGQVTEDVTPESLQVKALEDVEVA